MANLRELNQSNPFWEWVSDIEKQSRNASRNGGEGSSRQTTIDNDEETPQPDKDIPDHDLPDWDEKLAPPPPPPEFDGPTPPGPDGPHPPPPPPGFQSPPGDHHHHHHPGGERGRDFRRGGPHCGGGRHRHQHDGGWGGFKGWGGPPMFNGPFGGRRGGGFRRGGGGGGRGPWEGMFGRGGLDFGQGGFDMNKLAEMLKSFGIDLGTQRAQDDDKDFTPAIDVFDTPQAYYVHLSLAGAKKQDLDVSWDAENFQVIVSGIIHRPGDEAFLKTLAVEERDIGLFERKIKLGTKSDPVSVDADSISAKMEDGVLMIKVPKHEEFVEIKKVDIE